MWLQGNTVNFGY